MIEVVENTGGAQEKQMAGGGRQAKSVKNKTTENGVDTVKQSAKSSRSNTNLDKSKKKKR